MTTKRFRRMKAPTLRLVEDRPRFQPSLYQQAIFDFIRSGTGDGLVNAVAGSGKTTTLIEAARLIDVPALFVAFNKHIVDELEQKLDGTVMAAKTLHSIGHMAVIAALGKAHLETSKYSRIVRSLVETEILPNRPGVTMREATETLAHLVNFARLTLTDPRNLPALEEMARRYSLVPEDDDVYERCLHLVDDALVFGNRQAQESKFIDFTDMIYLPAIWRLQPPQYDFVFVDECQDLNAAQLDLALKCRATGGRMLFVGDSRQAIYGFAGADAASFRNIAQRTNATQLPLSICYRCPASHITLAQEIVSAIESRPNAPQGEILTIGPDDLAMHVREGDMVLCRMTAPLVSLCINFIQRQIPALVRGKDIGKQLTGIVDAVAKLRNFTFPEFGAFLDLYADMQQKKLRNRDDNEDRLESLRDQVEAVRACFLGFQATTARDLSQQIADLFSDEDSAVLLSTVHRAKGLERERVFLLRPDKLPLTWPKQQPWQLEQEMNLRYVALTRAKQTLVFVSDAPEKPEGSEQIGTGAGLAAPEPIWRDAVGDVVMLINPCPTCRVVAWETPYPGYAVCGVCHPAGKVADHRREGRAA